MYLLNSQIKELPVLLLVSRPQVILNTLAPAANIFGAGPGDLNGAKEHDGQLPRLRFMPKTRLRCRWCHDLSLQSHSHSGDGMLCKREMTSVSERHNGPDRLASIWK